MSNTANQVIRNLLKSADASWLEGGGHDWKQAVEEAETHLRQSESAAPTGSVLCPHCGSVPAEDWIHGFRGWICGSYNAEHSWSEKSRIVQSNMCASMHWQIRALKAEARVRELEAQNEKGQP